MEDNLEKLREPGSHVKVGVFDIDGVMRGKYISSDKFSSAVSGGIGFCDVIFGWDVNDQLYSGVEYTGWHSGYPDAQANIDIDSRRALSFEGNTPFFLADFAGRAAAVCPRNLLKRVIRKCEDMQFVARAGIEYEFLVFNETSQSVIEKSYKNLVPFGEGNSGYSVLRNSVHSDFYTYVLEHMEKLNIPIEGLHEETGPGVLEAAITVDTILESADKAALFKTFFKVLCQKQGKIATFMAKRSNDAPGQGGHIHLSLADQSGNSVFHDREMPNKISETMRHFIGGQQKLLPEFLALLAPTINSYSRLTPGFWAPTTASWGIENRTVALRAIPGSPKSQRVESRVPSADSNPYLALSAALASGLYGIENKIEPTTPMTGNAYEQKMPDMFKLPGTLLEASQRLNDSTVAREWFGDEFVDHFVATREWEVREFQKHVSDWEVERYFEII
ncbi:MAG: glutamine synthetase family protein [Alphaproteobacteria bacterium]